MQRFWRQLLLLVEGAFFASLMNSTSRIRFDPLSWSEGHKFPAFVSGPVYGPPKASVHHRVSSLVAYLAPPLLLVIYFWPWAFMRFAHLPLVNAVLVGSFGVHLLLAALPHHGLYCAKGCSSSCPFLHLFGVFGAIFNTCCLLGQQ